MLAIPFTVILTLAVLFAEPLGFVAVDPGIIALWLLGLFGFWVGGWPFLFLAYRDNWFSIKPNRKTNR